MCWDGKCMHIMYSDNANGIPMYDEQKSTTKFIGFYMDEKSDKSENPKDYEWHEIKE